MASREQNEAVAGLLRRSLARDAATRECPEPDMLAAYFEHSLDAAATANFDRHLSGCSRCREQLAAMVRAEMPTPQTKTLWLLDWRLLSAAAVVMVIVTVLLLRRPEQRAPIPQTASAPLVAMSKEAPKSEATGASTSDDSLSTVPSGSRDATNEAKPRRALRASAGAPQSNFAERIGDKKLADAGAAANSVVAGSVAKQSANNQVAETESADIATAPQPAVGVGIGQGAGGTAPAQKARAGHSAASQQQQQQQMQVPASSQMVLVQPSAARKPVATPQRAPAQEKAANASPVTPAARSESVEVTSQQQPQNETNDKQSTQAVTSGFTANNQQASLQILHERSRESVIDTPIPAVKWRITAAGFVERSEDGGATWNGQEPDPAAHLIAGSAPTDKVCWLVGKEGVVLVTKDGASWKKIPPPATTDITSVSAKSASAATVTTADGRRFTTKNEGKKWKPVN